MNLPCVLINLRFTNRYNKSSLNTIDHLVNYNPVKTCEILHVSSKKESVYSEHEAELSNETK